METALLVVDAQNGVLRGAKPCFQGEEVIGRIANLIQKARVAGVPVIYVQDDDVGPEGSDAWSIHAAVAPSEGELVVRKRACDSFHGTDLHEQLQGRGIRHLTVAGAKTQYCVESVCRRATTLGYNVTLVGDAHTTSDTPVLSAEAIIAHTNWTMNGFDNLEYRVDVRMATEVTFK